MPDSSCLLGHFCYLYKSEHKKTISLKSLVLTLFSPPAVSGCTGNHFSSQRLFKINFLCVRSDFLYNKNLTLFNINFQGFLNFNFFPPFVAVGNWNNSSKLISLSQKMKPSFFLGATILHCSKMGAKKQPFLNQKKIVKLILLPVSSKLDQLSQKIK